MENQIEKQWQTRCQLGVRADVLGLSCWLLVGNEGIVKKRETIIPKP